MKMREMRCQLCPRGLATGDALHRFNEKGKGIEPIWRCSQHMAGKPIDASVKAIASALRGDASEGLCHDGTPPEFCNTHQRNDSCEFFIRHPVKTDADISFYFGEKREEGTA